MSLLGTPQVFLCTSSPYIPTLYSQCYIFYAQLHLNFTASGSYSHEQTTGAKRFAFNFVMCLWRTLTKLALLQVFGHRQCQDKNQEWKRCTFICVLKWAPNLTWGQYSSITYHQGAKPHLYIVSHSRCFSIAIVLSSTKPI